MLAKHVDEDVRTQIKGLKPYGFYLFSLRVHTTKAEKQSTHLGVMAERRSIGWSVHYKAQTKQRTTTKFERSQQSLRVWPSSKNTLWPKGQIYVFPPFYSPSICKKYLSLFHATLFTTDMWVKEIRINKINYYSTFPSFKKSDNTIIPKF